MIFTLNFHKILHTVIIIAYYAKTTAVHIKKDNYTHNY